MTRCAIGVVCAVVWCPTLALAVPAFPGAQGFGAGATGGRGGEVFHVVNTLNTNVGTYEGPNGYNRGTLRWCILSEVSSLPRTVVFDVSGQVTLSSQITIENGNMTIAGQTAPGQGMTTAGKPWLIEAGGNLIIRHIRNRLGRNGGQDSIGVEGGSNIIFDHVTSSWSNDEALSVAKDGNFVTVQNSLIYEGLNHSGHGYGSLIRPDIDSKVTYHHNLYANNESRNPRPGTYNSRTLDFDFRNNVIYNWGHRAGYSGGSSEGNPEYVNMNFVGNYSIAGPSTANNATSAFITDTNAVLRAYQSGNLIDSDFDNQRDGVDTGWGMFEVEGGSLIQVANPHPLAANPVTTQSAADAYESVLNYAGSFWHNRDAHDTRVISQVRNQTGSLINHESEVGGFLPPASETRPVSWDLDHDGMPDAWEAVHGLNSSLSADRNNDFDNDGFTNLEEYLNEAGAWPAPQAITWMGGNGRFALNQNWDTWQPSHFDEVRITSGTATVDAVGQRAGIVKVSSPTGTSVLEVSTGWLDVTIGVEVGTTAASGALELGAGGLLLAPMVAVNAQGLIAGNGEIVGNVLNSGTVRPGTSAGTLTITGDFLQSTSGKLSLEITSADSFDQLQVSGILEAGGTLEVLLAGYDPEVDDRFPLLGFATAVGAFDLNLPELNAGLAWDTSALLTSGTLTVVETVAITGDFDSDGDVDGRDFLLWQRGVSPDPRSAADLAAWQAAYGGSSLSAVGVPEPGAVGLVCILGGILSLRATRFGLRI